MARPKPQPQNAPPSSKPQDATITSRQNPLLKEIIAIRDERDSPLLFLEGPRLILEAVNANSKLEMLIVSDEFPKISFLDPIVKMTSRVVKVSDPVFRAISDVENPQGLLAIARQPLWSWEQILKNQPAPILVLDGLQVPGNAASIVRTAEAAGVAGVITTPGTAHLYSPKALRGAMGSTIRVPIIEHVSVDKIASTLKKAGYKIAGTPLKDMKSAKRYDQIDWSGSWAIIVGKEGKGVSGVWDKLIDVCAAIPMKEPVQSLNVAAAAAILLYEVSRHRHQGGAP